LGKVLGGGNPTKNAPRNQDVIRFVPINAMSVPINALLVPINANTTILVKNKNILT
jgi:hypothetical protein